jgi:transcriptional regulator with XRE-family HTH domain
LHKRLAPFRIRISQYILERIKLACTEDNESQDDLARIMQKSKDAISDMERGRIEISAADLVFIAVYFEKPISYFFPPQVSIKKSDFSKLAEETLFLFEQLPEQQQYITVEYIKQQLAYTNNASDRQTFEEISKIRNSNNQPELKKN